MKFDNWNESRESQRVSLEASAFVSLNKKLHPGRVKDVSPGAICIHSNQPFPLGTSVDLVILMDETREVISGYISRVGTGEIVVSTLARSSDKLRRLYQSLS